MWSKMDFFDFFGLFSKAFSGETIDFCEKSFCTAVSRYNISHMTPMTHTFEKKEQPYCFIYLWHSLTGTRVQLRGSESCFWAELVSWPKKSWTCTRACQYLTEKKSNDVKTCFGENSAHLFMHLHTCDWVYFWELLWGM